jgi:hypothetical protein
MSILTLYLVGEGEDVRVTRSLLAARKSAAQILYGLPDDAYLRGVDIRVVNVKMHGEPRYKVVPLDARKTRFEYVPLKKTKLMGLG